MSFMVHRRCTIKDTISRKMYVHQRTDENVLATFESRRAAFLSAFIAFRFPSIHGTAFSLLSFSLSRKCAVIISRLGIKIDRNFLREEKSDCEDNVR